MGDEYKEHIKTAAEMFKNDSRFRVLVQSCVTGAMQSHRFRSDSTIGKDDVYDVALNAAAVLLKRIYLEDAELAAMRYERDTYRDSLAKMSAMVPLPPVQIVVDAETAERIQRKG